MMLEDDPAEMVGLGGFNVEPTHFEDVMKFLQDLLRFPGVQGLGLIGPSSRHQEKDRPKVEGKGHQGPGDIPDLVLVVSADGGIDLELDAQVPNLPGGFHETLKGPRNAPEGVEGGRVGPIQGKGNAPNPGFLKLL